MKLRLISDMHLDFLDPARVTRTINALLAAPPVDAVIIAGDLAEASTLVLMDFIHALARKTDHVFYVLGNHEYYGMQYHEVAKLIRADINPHNNIHFLNNQRFILNGINFIGSTLWTDFENRNPLVMNACQNMMRDCSSIRFGRRYMTTCDQLALHIKAKRWLFKACEYGTACGLINFVITHHAPTFQSVHERYRTGTWSAINGGFASDLSNEILDHKIHTWVHGHTHTSHDYMVGNTRVIANPHGYQDENSSGFDIGNIIEVHNAE